MHKNITEDEIQERTRNNTNRKIYFETYRYNEYNKKNLIKSLNENFTLLIIYYYYILYILLLLYYYHLS